jgi:predicted DnaQ family exonuclease/DinG family helicase
MESALSSLLKDLDIREYVAIDLETTGLEPDSSEIIELGAVRFMDGEEVDAFSMLVKPSVPIPLSISKLTGIYDKDVKEAGDISEVLPLFSEFIGDTPLVGHNVLFDLNFLEIHAALLADDRPYLAKRTKKQFVYFPSQYYDSIEIARIFNPVLHSFRLGSVCKFYKIPLDEAHRAVHDARATGILFQTLLEQGTHLGQKTIFDMLSLLEPTREPIKDLFKKYLNYFEKNPGRVEADYGVYWNFIVNNFNIIGNPEKRGDVDPDGQPESIDVDEVTAAFAENGKLAAEYPSYETRDPQEKMAVYVAEALNEEKFLTVEAGTGTGKSLAYLVPAIKFAVKNRLTAQRVIVSTNTKNLQEQLFYKDLPLLAGVMEEDFSAVLLKGKGNYLCLDRYYANLSDQQHRLNLYERKSVLPLFAWSQITQTGDISENSGFQAERNGNTWSKFIAENNYCPGRKCHFYKECFLMKARNQAKNADLVVVNHSLTFSDLMADNSILGEYGNIIFDEAHNIEKTATDYLGIDLNYWMLRRLSHRLYRKDKRETGITVQFEKYLEKSGLDEARTEKYLRMAEQIRTLSLDLDEASQLFFRELTEKLRFETGNTFSRYQTKVKFDSSSSLVEKLGNLLEPLKRLLETLRKELNLLAREFSGLEENSFYRQEQLQQEINAMESLALTLLESVEYFGHADMEEMINWFELPGKQENIDTLLRAVPMNIAEVLRESLFLRLRSAVFASATLAVGRRFDYFESRIGIDALPKNRKSGFIAGSPFDFTKQVKVMVAGFLPDPRHEQFSPDLMELIRNVSRETRRGMLILFTSYGLLNQVYENVKFHFDSEKHLLLAQGKDGSRNKILNRFLEDESSVLMGTDSFWEGVDVPGTALEILMLTKLPFEVPSDPVISARMRQIEENGGNSFFDYSVPEAIIKFRQGFGRLIRSREDRGVVIITDTRVAKMRYGKNFLDALPAPSDIYLRAEDFYRELKEWFNI